MNRNSSFVEKPTRGTAKDFIQLARPQQYLKNGFVLLPLIFGYEFFNPVSIAYSLFAFFGFCLAASATYAFNDSQDIDEDRVHPFKRQRPLASGRITRRSALWFAALLAIGSLGVGLALHNWPYLGILVIYLLLHLVYSLKLKHIAVIDVVAVSIGFVLRVFAGGFAISITPSHWLVLMTFLLALFISFAKRRDDLIIASSSNSKRESLTGYSLEFVSGAMMVMAAVTIVSYILYTVSPDVIQKHGTEHLYLTTFWVIVGLLRYMQVTFVREKSGSPTQVLLKDLFLQAVVSLWFITFLGLICLARLS